MPFLRSLVKTFGATAIVGATTAAFVTRDIKLRPIPDGTLLDKYSAGRPKDSYYTDCFETTVTIPSLKSNPQSMSQRSPIMLYMRSFYSSPVFNIERTILSIFKPFGDLLPGALTTTPDILNCNFDLGDTVILWRVIDRKLDTKSPEILLCFSEKRYGVLWFGLEQLDDTTLKLRFGSGLQDVGPVGVAFHQMYFKMLIASAAFKMKWMQ